MSQAFSIHVNAETAIVHVAGELTFSTARDVVRQARTLFADLATVAIDLAEVTRSDSAGVAVLIDWMRYAKQNDKPLVFHHLPTQMIAIASASGLDEVFPIAPSN
jgi:phospholipid transport system transporter-binding protein